MTLQTRSEDYVPRPARLTAKDFWLLAESGAFDKHARTELIEGEIWVVNSVHRWHARVMGEFHYRLRRAVEDAGLSFQILVAGSVSMSDESVPEPDLSLIAPLHPGSKTIERDELRIAVEIGDSTAAFDISRKAKLYAHYGVPEYWIVHRERQAIIQMWSPAPDGYKEQREVAFGSALDAATIDGLALETAGLS
jgi:Uma2 family endonuclease